MLHVYVGVLTIKEATYIPLTRSKKVRFARNYITIIVIMYYYV